MGTQDRDSRFTSPELRGYRGRWVALLNGHVIGQGGTPEQALYAARQSRYKETPEVIFIPLDKALKFPPILETITSQLPKDLEIYLVGGAVRDALLHHISRDLDFIVVGDSLKVARKLANKLNAAYFPLDEERDTARIVVVGENGERIHLDFTALRGLDLESDLRGRDFTINAMAVNIHDPEKVLDPLKWCIRFKSHRLRACSPSSITDDPVRHPCSQDRGRF
jgi:predicted nucleotidyltransferase